MTVIGNLKIKQAELQRLIQLAQQKLENTPEGVLYLRCIRGKWRYYHQTTAFRTYLGEDKKATVKALEEKAYYTALLKAAEKQLKIVEEAIAKLEKSDNPEQIFLKIAKHKTHLIEPYKLPSANHTMTKAGKHMRAADVNSTFVTAEGEHVRSKSELIIADRLHMAGIPYTYESNAMVGELMQVNPDFTVMNPRTGEVYFWEHFGMMDSTNYCENNQIKLENYADGGIFPGRGLIVTYESSARPLSSRYIDQVIKEFLN